MENREKEILNGVQAQISSFDNKASILLSVVGIIFALTLSFLDVFHADYYIAKSSAYKGWYFTLFIIYIILTIVLIVSLILVIIPRSHKTKKKYSDYYKDIDDMSIDKLKESIYNSSKNDTDVLEQIKINSNICAKKHYCLKLGAIMYIPFIICIVIMILLVMIA